METSIQKWGNSLGVRLPQHLAQKKSLTEGSHVLVTETATGLAITLIKKPAPTLASLLQKVTKANQPEVINWGEGVGKEIW